MTVIYLFVSPSGRAYAGRHTCQHEGWPRRGSGALPSGYTGSGKLWQNVARKHGPAIRWIILRRFGPDAARADIDAAERRAIRLVRAIWGERCVNVLEGGEGSTRADALRMWSCPEFAEKVRAAHADPKSKAKMGAAAKAYWSEPEARARRSEPEFRAKISAATKACAQTPDLAAQLAAALAYRWSPEGRAKVAAKRALREAAE